MNILWNRYVQIVEILFFVEMLKCVYINSIVISMVLYDKNFFRIVYL